MSDYLEHYGVKRRSGRYEWGSGEVPYQHESWFLNRVDDLRKAGKSNKEIAEALSMTMDEFNQRNTIERAERKKAEIAFAVTQKKYGVSNEAIGQMLGGKGESYVRTLLDPSANERNKVIYTTRDIIKDAVDKKDYVDIGEGSELYIGVTRTKMDSAIRMLRDEGYVMYTPKVQQIGTGKNTTMMILGKPGTSYKDLMEDIGKVHMLTDACIEDKGDGPVIRKVQFPQSIDSSRIFVKYYEDGGVDKDGVIEIRRGVPDLDLGQSLYSQVRIAVDKDKYLKGMAVYSDNVPDGYDVVLNSNKHRDEGTKKAFKTMEYDKEGNIDKQNPFGANILPKGQSYYIGSDGKEHLSAINKVNDEGTWSGWANNTNLAAQFLSKQPLKLVKSQLNLSIAQKQSEFDEIMNYTNPEIKKKFLQDFADECDAAACDLKAAGLPRQSACAILPINSLKDNEIYAPNYRNGEEVICIRYPHAGTFEIPRLTVNNDNKEAKSVIQNARDAVGINSKVASKLSGADFDGDSVIVIPTKGINVKVSKQLNDLKDFEPKELYKLTEEQIKADPSRVMTKQNKGRKMGEVTNLITDMTIKGASEDEIVRAVKHSMCVIDAEKHKLDWKRSEEDNRIKELQRLYQNHGDGSNKHGASTLLSRAKNERIVPERSYYKIDPDSGERIWVETGRSYVNKKGKLIEKMTKSNQMTETSDAFTLSSGTAVENYYAEYANSMKDYANKARLAILNTPSTKKSPSAVKIYENEINSIQEKIIYAEKNKPLERKAQIIANSIIKAQIRDNPDIREDKDWYKKIKNSALAEGRAITGASKKERQVHLTDKEWQAIQSGAVGSTLMKRILSNSDSSEIRKLATPKENTTANYISTNKANINLAKSMLASGYTQAEVADRLGCSRSLVSEMVHS